MGRKAVAATAVGPTDSLSAIPPETGKTSRRPYVCIFHGYPWRLRGSRVPTVAHHPPYRPKTHCQVCDNCGRQPTRYGWVISDFAGAHRLRRRWSWLPAQWHYDHVCAELLAKAGVTSWFRLDGKMQHAALQMPNGRWRSKMGKGPVIEHYSPDSLSGGLYGQATIVMRRAAAVT